MVEKMGFEKNRRFVKQYNNVPTRETIGGKEYLFRSKSEIKLAKYLELLKIGGYIKDWEYESHRFIFGDIFSWLVDFAVRNNDDSFEYYEFKGLCEKDTKQKIYALHEYYPKAQVTMVFSDKKNMKKFGTKAISYCKRVCLLKDLKV